MNALPRVALAVVLALVPFVAEAQNEPAPKPELPPGPAIASAPEFSQWVTTFSYLEDRAAALAHDNKALPPDVLTRTRTITTTKTKEIVHEEYVDGNGTKFDEWHVGPVVYMKDPAAKQWGELSASTAGSGATGGPNYSRLPTTGFRDLDWITRENYAGTIKLGDRPCLVFIVGAPSHFILSSSALTSQADELDSFSRVAYVDAETRLPMQVQISGVLRYYRFGTAPTDKLTLPPDLTNQLEVGEEGRAVMSQRLPRPY
jgi:hypothetical protein